MDIENKIIDPTEAIRINGEWLFYLDGQLIQQEKNTIVSSGLNYLASLLVNENTNDMAIYMAFGTGTSAVTPGDTKLGSEGGRKFVTTKASSDAMAKFRTFLISDEAVGEWTEFGIFLAGTEQVNSGTLLNRIVPTGGISKTDNTVLTIEVRLTFSM